MSKNNVQNSGAKSQEKSDGVNSISDTEIDIKPTKEELLRARTSQAPILDSENVSGDETSRGPGKRKREITPLLVSNIPEKYNLMQITDYLVKTCGACEVSFINNRDSRAVEAIFGSTSERAKAKKILSSESIDDMKIRVDSPILRDDESEVESEHEEPEAKRRKEIGEPWGVDQDVWRPDPKGWYGIKPKYLESLGIQGELQNWVMVTNFRVGNEELRDLMCLAGDVLVCSVSYLKPKKFARVMYRHPLEALQAVSMLNNQIFYGTPLSVKIIKASGAILPKGLKGIGPGLAKYGGPLRDVLRHYERFLKGQENDLNTGYFRTPEEQCRNDNDTFSSVEEDNKKRAREALETLVAMVSQGVKINDLLEELKSINADKKDSIEQILKELDTTDQSDSTTNEKNGTEDKDNDQNAVKDNEEAKNDKGAKVETAKSQPSPISKAPSGPNSKSQTDDKKTKEPPRTSQQTPSPAKKTNTKPVPNINTIGKNRPKITPVAKGNTPNYRGTQRPKIGAGNSGPSGPKSNSVRPAGPRFPVWNNMSGPNQGSMSGSNKGPMSGRMSGPMSGPRSGPMPGPMSGSMSGPMCGPMSGPMSGPMLGPMCGPMGGSGPAGPMSGPMNVPNFSMPGPNNQPPFGPNIQQSGNDATLQFSNLPLSTTFNLLSDKLSQVGQLQNIQFTTPGCVLVTFANRMFAERCRQQFDQSRLEGNLIDVRFV